MAKNTSRLAASRVADVATIRTFETSWRRKQFGVIGQRGPRPLDRLGRELARGIHALAQSHDAHLAVHVAQPAVDRIGDQQPDRVRAAVDRTDTRHVHTSLSSIPTMPGSTASNASASSPKGLTPGPFASE